MINFFKKKPKKSLPPNPEADIVIGFNEEEITAQRPNSNNECVRWENLLVVQIATSDNGPFGTGLIWTLAGINDDDTCTFPGGATGVDELLEEMQSRLPGFDNESFIKAMSSTVDDRFIIWKKPSNH